MLDSNHKQSSAVSSDRIELIDAIRGFALFGILLMNLEAFTGPISLAMTGINAELQGADYWTDALIYIFVQGKFWTLFSLLFGISFAIMYERLQAKGDDFYVIYARRLAGLLVIGLAHFLLIWEGDILVTYALAGFVLLMFSRSNAPIRISTILALYTAPLLLTVLIGYTGAEQHDSQALSRDIANEAAVFGHGSYFSVLAWRANDFFDGNSSEIFLLPMTVAMFALGARLYRRGKVKPLPLFDRHAFSQAAVVWFAGLAIILFSLTVAPAIDPTSLNKTLAQVFFLNSIGSLLMCMGCFFMLRSLWALDWGRKLMRPLAAPGRMALSNYLSQSIICTAIFYGYGLGFYQQMPRAWHILFAILLFGLQVLFSHWWLNRFTMGPVEYLWRWMTYGKRPKFVS